jgi:hypothetical protein
MKLKTINGKEYFVKLKELEMNEDGEFVMTLRSSSGSAFQNQIIESSRGNLLLSSSKHFVCADENNQQTQQATRGFVKIENVLSGILQKVTKEKQ